MSPHLSSDSVRLSLPDRIDLQLFHKAQAYLERRKACQTPSEEETQAWEWFYATYDLVLRRFVLACGVRQADRGDCRQEAWMEVDKKLPAFFSEGSQGRLCSWLKTIVHSTATDLLRYQMRHPTKRTSSGGEVTFANRDGNPAAEYEQHARQVAVHELLALLEQHVSALAYRIFEMRFLEEGTIAEIAAELTLGPRQVVCSLHRTKRKFRLLCERGGLKGLLTQG